MVVSFLMCIWLFLNAPEVSKDKIELKGSNQKQRVTNILDELPEKNDCLYIFQNKLLTK